MSKSKKDNVMRTSIIRTIAISVVYGFLEAHYVNLSEGGNVISEYHLLVLLIGVITGFDKEFRIWLANVLVYSVLEDICYWVFIRHLPYQWSTQYIVVCHVPVYYVPYIIIAVILYKKGKTN
jgi:hypothetical protein